MHDKGSKGMCKRWLCAMHDQCMKNAHVGQGVLNTQPMNQTSEKPEKPQSLVLIEVQTSEKMPKRHFIKHLASTL